MGRRGPANKDGASGPTAVLSIRMSEEMKLALERAAKTSGRRLATEVETRLRQSFREDLEISKAFGSPRNYAIMRAIASLADATTNLKKPGSDWTSDPYAYEQVVVAVSVILELFRPKGEMPADVVDELDAGGHSQWLARAGFLIEDLQQAKPASPPDQKRNRRLDLAWRIRNDLGDSIMNRLPADNPWPAVHAAGQKAVAKRSRRTGAKP